MAGRCCAGFLGQGRIGSCCLDEHCWPARRALRWAGWPGAPSRRSRHRPSHRASAARPPQHQRPPGTRRRRHPNADPQRGAEPDITAAPRPRVAETIADDLDVPWGIAFLPSGNALVSERNTGRIRKITPRGKISTLGEVAGVDAPSGLGEGGLMGIALDPATRTPVRLHDDDRNDDRVVRMSIAGGKVGRPQAVLTGIPTSVHHHGGRLLFDRNGLLYVSTGDAEQSGPGPGPGCARRARSCGSARTGGGARQPVRQPDLELRSSQHRGAGVRRGQPALGHRVRRAEVRRAQPDQEGQELRLAGRGGSGPELQIRVAGRRLVPDQQLLPGRPGHHPVHGVHRCAAWSVPVRGAAARRRRGRAQGVLRRATTAGSAAWWSLRTGRCG